MTIDPAVFESLRHKRECAQERRRMAHTREVQIINAAQTVVAIMQSRMAVTEEGCNMHASESEHNAYRAAMQYLTKVFSLTEPGSR